MNFIDRWIEKRYTKKRRHEIAQELKQVPDKKERKEKLYEKAGYYLFPKIKETLQKFINSNPEKTPENYTKLSKILVEMYEILKFREDDKSKTTFAVTIRYDMNLEKIKDFFDDKLALMLIESGKAIVFAKMHSLRDQSLFKISNMGNLLDKILETNQIDSLNIEYFLDKNDEYKEEILSFLPKILNSMDQDTLLSEGDEPEIIEKKKKIREAKLKFLKTQFYELFYKYSSYYSKNKKEMPLDFFYKLIEKGCGELFYEYKNGSYSKDNEAYFEREPITNYPEFIKRIIQYSINNPNLSLKSIFNIERYRDYKLLEELQNYQISEEEILILAQTNNLDILRDQSSLPSFRILYFINYKKLIFRDPTFIKKILSFQKADQVTLNNFIGEVIQNVKNQSYESFQAMYSNEALRENLLSSIKSKSGLFKLSKAEILLIQEIPEINEILNQNVEKQEFKVSETLQYPSLISDLCNQR